ncbi:MAG: anti-sigma F factor [Bacillota bacterium]
MEVRNTMQLEILAVPENVGVARLALGSFASQMDFTLAELDEIKVAVSEAVTNSVVHAYPVGPGPVVIAAEHDGRELLISVRDSGRGIADVAQARQPSFSTDPERMGLGFVFMDSFMDQLEVDSRPGQGTTVTMRKRCQAGQRTEAAAEEGSARRGG